MKSAKKRTLVLRSQDYDAMLDRVVRLIDEARRTSARTCECIHDRDLLVDWPPHCRI